MMPQLGGMMGAPAPQITEDMIEQAKLIAEACTWEEISGVLRSDERRNYNIDVETTATAFEDDMEEKQQRTEFMGAMTQWLQVAMPAIQANPSQAPLFKELTMFFMGGFKVGRSLEETFEDAFDQIKNMPPQPNPEAEKLKGEMEMAKQKHGMEMQKGQAELQAKGQVAQMDAAGKQGELQMKQQAAQMDLQAQQQQLQADQQKAQLEMQIKLAELQLKREEMQMEREKMALDRQAAQEEHQLKREGLAIEGQAIQQKAEIDQQSMVMDHQMHAEKSKLDMETHREASELKRDDMKFQSDFKRKEAARAQKTKAGAA
jgi:hypothetical protein